MRPTPVGFVGGAAARCVDRTPGGPPGKGFSTSLVGMGTEGVAGILVGMPGIALLVEVDVEMTGLVVGTTGVGTPG